MTQMAMTQNFVWIATDDTEGDYLEYKQHKEDNIIRASERDMEYFDFTFFPGYHGYTLSCRTKGIYDLYRVYEKGNLICESEDPVIELPYMSNHFVIKAYDRLSEGRLLELGEGANEIELPPREHSRYYNLSVVVPCYKSELFMCRTIDAILSSSLPDIELILVNDGSPDHDLEIAHRYADNYSCVEVIDKPNSGASESRNMGMELCTGEYTAFCDSDDIPHPYMYEQLFMTCKEQGTDIAIASVLIRDFPNKKEWYMRIGNDVVYTFEEMMKMKDTKDNIYFVAVRNKIIKTEIAKKVKSPTEYAGQRFPYEDISYTGSLYSYIDKFAYCNDAIYIREKRKRQTVGTVSTWDNGESNDFIWKSWIYAASYPLYIKSGKHLERHDYRHFKRMIESYRKFKNPSELKTYRETKLKEIIDSQKLYDNKLIMEDKELSVVVDKLKSTTP